MPKKITYSDVKEYVESNGYELLSESYTYAKDKLEMLCPEGHFG